VLRVKTHKASVTIIFFIDIVFILQLGFLELNLYLDVFKIPKTFENPFENSGLVVQLLSKTDRYFVPDVFGSYSLFHNKYGRLTQQNKFKYHSKQETKVDVKYLKTIQIRAGPFSYFS